MSILEQLEPRFRQDKEFIATTIQSLQLSRGSIILDIGTGWGKMAIYLALNGYSVITGEPSKWTDWENYAEKAGVRDMIEYREIDAQQMDFPNESVDAIFLLGSLHHIPDKRKAMKEFLRVLKSEGKLILFDYTEIRINRIRKHSHHHPPPIDPTIFLKDFPVTYSDSIDENNEIFCFIIKKN